MCTKTLLLIMAINLLIIIPENGLCSATTARSAGLCNASTASSRGLESIKWNPANLVCDSGSGFEMILPSITFDARNNSFSLNRYNEISGATLSSSDKQEILSDIPDGGLRMDINTTATLLGIRKGNIAFTINGLGTGFGTIDKDIVDLVLMGNEINREFSFNNTDAQGHAIASATLSYARPLLTNKTYRLSAGINTHYLYGIFGFDIASATGNIITEIDGINGSASAEYLTAKGGSGYAIDIGLCLQAPRGWTFGLSTSNIAGSMNWDSDVELHQWTASVDSIALSNDDISDQITTTESSVPGQNWTEKPNRVLRVGCSNKFGVLKFSADVTQQITKRSDLKNNPELSFGFEIGSKFIQPRFGFAVGGPAQQRVATGLGLNIGHTCLDIAAMTSVGFGNKENKGVALSSSMLIRF
jgi:hypothetical protein